MTPVVLLYELKKFIEDKTKDILLQTRIEPRSGELKERPAEVHIMQLPDKSAETKLIPYVLLQFLAGSDDQPEGQRAESECTIRIIVATYSENQSEGSLSVLNILTRIRIELLRAGVIGEQFLIKKPMEYIVYPDNTAPYHLGEMSTIWEIPEIEREVDLYGWKE